MDEIKKCPCCNGKGVVCCIQSTYATDSRYLDVWVECTRCGVSSPQYTLDTKDKYSTLDNIEYIKSAVIDVWNRRYKDE